MAKSRSANNARAAGDALTKQAAAGLLKAAVYLRDYLKRKLSQSYPPASLPGQYPHYRTGNLRDGVVVSPATLAEVERTLACGVAFQQAAWYGLYLELERGRKGLLAAQEECKATTARLTGEGKPG